MSPKKDETVIHFGEAAVHSVSRKKFVIRNLSQEKQTYKVQRSPDTSSLDYVFKFTTYSTSVKPKGTFMFNLVFKPVMPNVIYTDYFEILTREGVMHTIITVGESIGPNVSIKPSLLYFYMSSKKNLRKQRMEVENNSIAPAYFIFELDNASSVFKVNRTCHILAPNSRTYVEITFSPNESGIFCFRLACLIKDQEPVMTTLVGIKSGRDFFDPTFPRLLQHPLVQTLDGYKEFMLDCTNVSEFVPPFSFNVNFLDFKFCHEGEMVTKVVTVTNHLDEHIGVKWIFDTNSAFSIYPDEVLLPANESLLFECKFSAPEANSMYGSQPVCQIYWGLHSQQKDPYGAYLPIPASLRFLGHSFPSGNDWIPQMGLDPPMVVMPACVPGKTVYATLTIRRQGHLPLAFQFVPPKNTNYIIKPMCGVVSNDFQVAVIQLNTHPDVERCYVEIWRVNMNTMPDKATMLHLNGISQSPAVLVGYENNVYFGHIHPGSRELRKVGMKNITRHNLNYSFLSADKQRLAILEPDGVISPNATKFLDWWYTGDARIPPIVYVKCTVTAESGGKAVESIIQAHASASFCRLCAFPSRFDAGDVEYKGSYETTFHIFNFGPADMSFKLFAVDRTCTSAPPITLRPTAGTIERGGRQEVRLFFNPKEKGLFHYSIGYQVRTRDSELKKVDVWSPHPPLFLLKYFCVNPTVEVVDIVHVAESSVFSKVDLWNLLNIKNLNKALNEVDEGKELEVLMHVPDSKENTNFSVTLVLKNCCSLASSLRLKKVQLCDCKKVPIQVGISKVVRKMSCFHRDVLNISLSEQNIMPGKWNLMTIKVNYTLRGHMPSAYELKLTNNRCVRLLFDIYTMPGSALSSYDPKYDFKMHDVYIGDKEPPLQAFWLYNNSPDLTEYTLDCTDLPFAFTSRMRNIITCDNPTGLILPYSSVPLLLKFSPVQLNEYAVSVPLYLGARKYELQIRGQGSVNPKNLLHYTVPKDEISNCILPVVCSTDHILVDNLPSWGSTERAFSIRNNTNDKIFCYNWKEANVVEVLNARVIEPRGVLLPRESHLLEVQIQSWGPSALLDFRLSCEIFDYTKFKSHADSVNCIKQDRTESQQPSESDEEHMAQEPLSGFIAPPRVFFINLAVTCHICGIGDRDLKMKSDLQVKLDPLPEFSMLDQESRQEFVLKRECQLPAHESYTTLRTTFEFLLWDILESEMFRRDVECRKNMDSFYYTQIVESNTVTPTLSKDSEQGLSQLVKDVEFPACVVGIALRQMLFEGVTEHFKIKPKTPLTAKSDLKLKTAFAALNG